MTRREISPALLGSVLLHGLAAAALMISWNFGRDLKVGSVVPVTLVAEAPATDVSAAVEAPEVQAAQTEEPVPEAPHESVPPEPQPKPHPTPPTPKPPPAPALKPAQTPVKPAPAKPAEKSLDLDALAASLSKGAKPSSAAKGPARPETALAARPAVGAGVSTIAMSALGAELEKLWHYNCDVEGAQNVTITVSFAITPNGFVQPNSVRATKGEDRSTDPVVKVAAERAIRAVYQLDALRKIPPDFYGQRVASNFSGRSACS